MNLKQNYGQSRTILYHPDMPKRLLVPASHKTEWVGSQVGNSLSIGHQ